MCWIMITKTLIVVISIYKILIYWLRPYRQKKSSGKRQKSASGKSSSRRFLFSAARNANTKDTEYVTNGFSFCLSSRKV